MLLMAVKLGYLTKHGDDYVFTDKGKQAVLPDGVTPDEATAAINERRRLPRDWRPGD
jgi:hypothetical protein